MSNYLGIDLGTQSLKAVIYNAASKAVEASGSCNLEMTSRADGTREQHAEWWLDALREALSQIDPAIRATVAAVAVSGQQHGFVPLAADGTVLAPVKLWCDTSTTAECDEITQNFGGEERCLEEVGNPIVVGYTASKIAWLRHNWPEAYARLHTILLPHDYLNFYLTGERFAECGDASGTGLLDIRKRCWHPEIVAALDPDRDLLSCLPPLLAWGEVGGELSESVASELGLPVGIPVGVGGGDNMMAAIGTGNVQPGRLTISLGTSGTMFAYSDVPCVHPSGNLAAFCSSTGGWLPLLCTMNCTVGTELTRGLFDMDIPAMERALTQSQPGANGVVILPFYNGERSPNLPRGKGCIMGLDVDNMNRANILQASMEAAVFGLRMGLDSFREVGCDISDIRLTGGGSKSPYWRQMVADTFGLPVRVLLHDEGAAMGAALSALLLHQGACADNAETTRLIDEHVLFDDAATATPGDSQAYQESYQTYLRHLNHVKPMYI